MMKDEGWSHRQKRKSRDPYLKMYSKNFERTGRGNGATFIDMEKKFKWLSEEDVIEL